MIVTADIGFLPYSRDSGIVAYDPSVLFEHYTRVEANIDRAFLVYGTGYIDVPVGVVPGDDLVRNCSSCRIEVSDTETYFVWLGNARYVAENVVRFDYSPIPSDIREQLPICTLLCERLGHHTLKAEPLRIKDGTAIELYKQPIADPELPAIYFFVQVTAMTGTPARFRQYRTFTASTTEQNYNTEITPIIYQNGSDKVFGPSLDTIINDIDTHLGIAADDIVDISVSRRVPYACKKYTGDNEYCCLIDRNLNKMRPDLIVGEGGEMPFGWWTDESPVSRRAPFLVELNIGLSGFETCGFSIYSENNDRLYEIPRELFIQGGEGMLLQMIVTPWADMYGINTNIDIGQQHIMIPEGRLPYAGDQWQSYMLHEMEYDREMMQLGIQKQEADAVNGAVQSIANGAIAGAFSAPIGIASAAIGIAGTAVSTGISVATTRAAQDAKEAHVRRQPGSAYNTAYGLEYIRKALHNYCRVSIEAVPFTQEEYTQFVKYNGYPCDGLRRKLSASDLNDAQYIKGAIVSVNKGLLTNDRRKPDNYFSLLNNLLTNGARFINSAGDM